MNVVQERPALRIAAWLPAALLLFVAYGLLGLTFAEQLSHHDIMTRCVLVNSNLARIWSVANIEIGLSYFGVFASMVYYFINIYQHSSRHMVDLGLAIAYLALSFILDYVCVLQFQPFVAMLIGDAVVMTFTLIVSRQMWFQRLLGVFVPIIFITCSLGHLMEGLSYWKLTYPLNVPWTMVTADVGFAVLVNASRFPAFIRGEDVVVQLRTEKSRRETLEAEILARTQAEEALAESEILRLAEIERRERFVRDVMLAATKGRLRLHYSREELPEPLGEESEPIAITAKTISGGRRTADAYAVDLGITGDRRSELISAVAEALMNAVVHAEAGELTMSHNDNAVQYRIVDRGSGIEWRDLPYATLQQGWSSKGTLGLGFTLMMLADSVNLFTCAEGTTVVLTMLLP